MQNRHLLILAAAILSFVAIILASLLYFVPMEIEMIEVTTAPIVEVSDTEELDAEVETPLAIEQDFLSMEVLGTEANGEIVRSRGWMMNPTTGDHQSVRLYEPSKQGVWPVVVFIPGGTGDGTEFEKQNPGPDGGDSFAVTLASEGFVVVVYSPLGTGESEGDIDYQGFADQDGLASIIWATSQLPQVDTTNIGLASFSYGVTGAAGVLARYPELGVKYWSDWEGPTSRYFTTVGCPKNRNLDAVTPAKFPCTDDDHWVEREATEFVKTISLPYYWRVQETKDHVQPTYGHTIEILDTALENESMPWVKVNDAEVNASFTEETLPTVELLDKYEQSIIPHIVEMSEM